jgi:hypothetical protein
MERDLKLVLSAVDNTKKTLDEMSKRFESLDKEVGKATKEMSQFEKQGMNLKKVAGVLAGIFAVDKIIGFAKASVTAFQEVESAQARLAKITSNAVGATNEQIQALFDQASALEKVGVVDKVSTMNMQAKLATFDLTTEAIQKLTPTLLDYAVAEYGASVSGAQLATVAQGFGKALQGQPDLLTKAGFKLTEYQIAVMKNGDETQRLAMLNEILGKTYADVNAEMAKTSEGQLKQLQMQLGGIKEQIGQQLIPIILKFASEIEKHLPEIVKTIETLGKVIGTVIKIVFNNIGPITALAGAWVAYNIAIKTASAYSGIVGALTAVTSAAKISTTGIVGLIAKLKALQIASSMAFGIIGAAIAGAGILIANSAAKLKAVNEEVRESAKSATTDAQKLADAYNKAHGTALSAMDFGGQESTTKRNWLGIKYEEITTGTMNMEKYREAVKLVKKEEESLAKLDKISFEGIFTDKQISDMEKGANEIGKAISNMGEEYKKAVSVASESLFDLDQSHKKNMTSIRSEMDRTRQEMRKLQESFKQQEAGDQMGIAGQIVANEERMAEIQKELAKGVSAERQAELQAELDQRLLATQANADFINQFETQIAEVKRRNALTDLERAIEDFNAKRALAQQEFNEKMASLQKEMSALRAKEKEEKALYQEKRNFITSQLEELEKLHTENSTKAVFTTKTQVEKEIAYYKQLAEAIKAARSADTASFGRIQTNFQAIGRETKVNDAIITPRGDIISTHPDDWLIATKNPQGLGGSGSVVVNITGNSFMGEDDMAEKVGDKILDILKYNVKLTA